MASHNFEFLREHYPEIARIGEIAEQLLPIDASSCVAKIRYMAETITKNLYDRYELRMSLQPKFIDLLDDMFWRNVEVMDFQLD